VSKRNSSVSPSKDIRTPQNRRCLLSLNGAIGDVALKRHRCAYVAQEVEACSVVPGVVKKGSFCRARWRGRRARHQSPPAYAPPRLRLCPGQQGPRYSIPPGLSRPQEHPAHGPLHRVVAGSVQGLLAVANATARKYNVGMSDRVIAEQIGVGANTVRRARIKTTAPSGAVEKRTGRDGRTRKRRKETGDHSPVCSGLSGYNTARKSAESTSWTGAS
jgi:hypothetical protein